MELSIQDGQLIVNGTIFEIPEDQKNLTLAKLAKDCVEAMDYEVTPPEDKDSMDSCVPEEFPTWDALTDVMVDAARRTKCTVIAPDGERWGR